MLQFGRLNRKQPAHRTPFSSVGWLALNVLDAILEAASRANFSVSASHDGAASTGRYLSFTPNNTSDLVPFVCPKAFTLTEITFVASANATATVSIRKNGVIMDTVSLVAARKVTKSVSHLFAAMDEANVQVSAGSASKPSVYLYFRVT